MENVHDVFEFMLLGLYSAEKRNLDMLGEAIDEASEPALREAFERHRSETEGQVERLEGVFQVLNLRPRTVDASVIEGLVEEKRRFRAEDPTPDMLQVYNLAAAMKNEHIEVAAYDGILLLAERLNAPDVVEPLRKNLQEEQATLDRLRKLVKDVPLLDRDVGSDTRRREQPAQ